MGRIRDDIYESMWDEVTCPKHNITRPDSRFPCPDCKKESQDLFDQEREKANELLRPHNLTHLIRSY